ncbi:bifunctional phosphopantothenoylcysteine decarboxylase/phosphopantothenate--cysteine ligase CoaBC [Amaricoccus sp.]|uniref:bifunctional phosphopantothenoylcysteine decarboxylase/phosphopantothenate--cysteine ligase CoaBC n=1 Tax=Amaricoccus sp. TaxID=1872485 RepID=UPI001B764E88|nr:bifunctional phosphopantothenoylcysteine decarboxylase/phosphopantothenate--cysteine ligase CoaBC [Amaricoccus sp.]MBP7241675.1 bifunctional phosphopantothenoylcysteine decarboxylase/phosphopantothenate--cysteine ligase CoaBC [Amaricoccus sp.]
MLFGRSVLLIVGGGVAAYKSIELVRLIGKAGGRVTPVLTRAGAEFVTPLSLAAIAGAKAYRELFDLTDEAEMGHIQLSRAADLVVVAPATADLMAKVANGHADDLASTLLLATDKRVLLAPAMNVRMWLHPAVTRNVATLAADGALFVGPGEGEMACGEFGPGRMAEPAQILAAIEAALGAAPAVAGGGPLAGRHVLVTSGPTHEPIDPVRYIANRSSGRQGAAIAEALARRGARVSFVTGPAEAPRPAGCEVHEVETAVEMLAAAEAALPADAAVFAAAVADWRVVSASGSKMKKDGSGAPPRLELVENPDILKAIARRNEGRPRLVVGFAAETDDVLANAAAKRLRKGCDWLVANDVSPATGIMGGTENAAILITEAGAEAWPRLSKVETAERLADRIAQALA